MVPGRKVEHSGGSVNAVPPRLPNRMASTSFDSDAPKSGYRGVREALSDHGSPRENCSAGLACPRSFTWSSGIDRMAWPKVNGEAGSKACTKPAAGLHRNGAFDPKLVRRSSWQNTSHRQRPVEVPTAKSPAGPTLRAVFKDLHDHDADCVIKLRRLQQLDHASAEHLLRRHFEQFGVVEQVWIVYSQIKANRSTVPRCKPSGLGFILMRSPEDVNASLQNGVEQNVGGFRIAVERFRVLAEVLEETSGTQIETEDLEDTPGTRIQGNPEATDSTLDLKAVEAETSTLFAGFVSLRGHKSTPVQQGQFKFKQPPHTAPSTPHNAMLIVRNTFLHVREQGSACRSSSV